MPRSPAYRALAAAVREVFPDAVVVPGLMVAGTDSRHYLSVAEAAYRFLPLRLTQGDLGRLHGVNERIAVGNYAEVIGFYARLIRNAADSGREPSAGARPATPGRSGRG